MTVESAYIGLGSNLGNRLQNLDRALHLLAGPNLDLLDVSAVYETEPVGGPIQGLYLNACAHFSCLIGPVRLLERMLAVEASMGRKRNERWGPRLIDLDLLLHGNQVIDTPFLQLPHPLIVERDFVLVPLADLDPSLQITGTGKNVNEILASRIGAKGISLYRPAGWFKA